MQTLCHTVWHGKLDLAIMELLHVGPTTLNSWYDLYSHDLDSTVVGTHITIALRDGIRHS